MNQSRLTSLPFRVIPESMLASVSFSRGRPFVVAAVAVVAAAAVAAAAAAAADAAAAAAAAAAAFAIYDRCYS